jgi:hypothetical protein
MMIRHQNGRAKTSSCILFLSCFQTNAFLSKAYFLELGQTISATQFKKIKVSERS